MHGLARAVRHISPHPPSPAVVRLTDLAGAVADLTALQRDNYDAAERWSTAVAVAEAIQTCVDYARRRPEHYDAAIYQTIHTAAAAVAQLAAADPPDPLRRTLLDTQAPAPAASQRLALAADAAPALAIALRQAHRHGGITLADGLASIAASYTATHYGQLVALAAEQRDDQAPRRDSDPPWRYAARAWQQVHRSLNSFDDGTRIRHTSATAIAAAAVQLHHGLRDHARRRRQHRYAARSTPTSPRLRPPSAKSPTTYPSSPTSSPALSPTGAAPDNSPPSPAISRTAAAASTPTSTAASSPSTSPTSNQPSPRYDTPTPWPSTSPANFTKAPASSASNPSPTWPTATDSGKKPAPPVTKSPPSSRQPRRDTTPALAHPHARTSSISASASPDR